MRTSMIAATIVLATAGCGGGKSEQARTESGAGGQQTSGAEMAGQPGGMDPSMAAACPVAVQGTTVQAENVEGGAALVFVTTGDVQDLRERVRHFAAMQESHAMRSAGQMGMHGGEQGVGMQGGAVQRGGEAAGAKTAEPMSGEMEDDAQGAMGAGTTEGGMAGAGEGMPQVNTRVEDIEGGARLVMIPMDSTQLDAVRTQVEQQVQTMAAGRCEPMSGAAGAMPPQ